MSEAVAIKRALEPLERAAAKQRQGRRTDKHPEKFSGSSKGRALDKVAAVAGMHRTTIAKAEAVVDAAAAEPERFANLLADMDRTGKVNGPFKRLGVLKQAAAIRAEPPPARGPYRVLVADVPCHTRSVRKTLRIGRPRLSDKEVGEAAGRFVVRQMCPPDIGIRDTVSFNGELIYWILKRL